MGAFAEGTGEWRPCEPREGHTVQGSEGWGRWRSCTVEHYGPKWTLNQKCGGQTATKTKEELESEGVTCSLASTE